MSDQLRCDVCDKVFTGPESAEQHFQSDKHKQKMCPKNNVQKECKPCKKKFDTEELYKLHLERPDHKRRVEAIEALKLNFDFDELDLNGNDRGAVGGNVGGGAVRPRSITSPLTPTQKSFHCEICDMFFTGPAPFEQHLSGKQHKKKMERDNSLSCDGKLKNSLVGSNDDGLDRGDENKFECKMCNKQFTGEIPLADHLNGKEHKKAEERMKRSLSDDGRKRSEDSLTGSAYLQQVVTSEMFLIVKNDDIGYKWRDLGRLLGLTEGRLQDVDHMYYKYGLSEIILQVLEEWKRKEGDDATVEKLIKVIEKLCFPELVKKIIDAAKLEFNFNASSF